MQGKEIWNREPVLATIPLMQFALLGIQALAFVGLAVAHAYAHRTIIPGMALVGFYLALVILGWPNGVMLVGALGAAEVWYGLRRKGGPRGEGGAPARTNDQES